MTAEGFAEVVNSCDNPIRSNSRWRMRKCRKHCERYGYQYFAHHILLSQSVPADLEYYIRESVKTRGCGVKGFSYRLDRPRTWSGSAYAGPRENLAVKPTRINLGAYLVQACSGS